MAQITYDPLAPDPLGVVVLQADVTIETEFRQLLPPDRALMVSRVPSGDDVTIETLSAMETELTRAASLFPRGVRFAAMGYGCTSGASVIGSARVAELLREGAPARSVHDPLCALIAACRANGVRRLGLVTPYTLDVTDRLREALCAEGIDCDPVLAFGIAEEAMVARIHADTVTAAARDMRAAGVDAVFLSCTNLRTLAPLRALKAETGPPVWSSNLVLAAALVDQSDDPATLLG